MHLKFTNSRAGCLKITQEVLAILWSYTQFKPTDTEAGGLLVGRLLLGGYDVVIDEITEPGPLDERTTHGFHRVDPGHQIALDRAWHNSHGTAVFLGSWHTHPEAHPTPSTVDIEDWTKTVREAPPNCPCFFIIVGNVETRVWECDVDTGALQLLSARKAHD